MTAARPPSVADVVRRHGLRADKRLGQHFLGDPSILTRIAAAAGPLEGRLVVEVGPGPGGLTGALLAAGAEVIAIERDRRFLPPLAELEARFPGRLRVVEADALTVDPVSLAPGRPVRIVANLPYNVATELLVRWLERIEAIERLVLMFQKEVALRLVARPNTKDYGRLSVLTQWLCRVERLFDLPPGAFHPPPKVASSVVRLEPLAVLPAPPLRTLLAEVTRAAFGQRRKMLRSSLALVTPDPTALLTAAGIEPSRRAEQLTVADFERLAVALAHDRLIIAGTSE